MTPRDFGTKRYTDTEYIAYKLSRLQARIVGSGVAVKQGLNLWTVEIYDMDEQGVIRTSEDGEYMALPEAMICSWQILADLELEIREQLRAYQTNQAAMSAEKN